MRFHMENTRILIIFIAAIISLSPAKGNRLLPGTQKTCSYSIQIETTCAPSAETADHVSVRFSDSGGNSLIVKDLRKPKLLYVPREGLKKQSGAYTGFERCAIDMFEASGPCMSNRVCSLYLKKFGYDGWRPGWVRVFRHAGGGVEVPVSNKLYFRTFVPENVWYGFDFCHPDGGFIPHVASFNGEE